MDLDTVYFTWPDRKFSYTCAGCGACCRGLGIGFDAERELSTVIARYPQLASFVRKRGSAITAFNPRGRCWFLDDGGLCRIESEHGRDTKPASCRLFPFNRVFRLGGYTIVDFNSVVCPLQVCADGEGISRQQVAQDIAAVEDVAVVGTTLPVSGDAGETIATERAIAAACFEQARAESPDLGAIWSAIDEMRPQLSSALKCVTGAALSIEDETSLRTALWLTPSLRFNEIFGPRRYGDADVLDRQWLVWLHLLCAGAQLAQRPLSLQQATSSWAELMPLAYVIARWHEQPRLTPGPVELPADTQLAASLRRFGEACTVNKTAKRSLGQIVEAISRDRPVHERVIVVRALEPLLPALRFGPGAEGHSARQSESERAAARVSPSRKDNRKKRRKKRRR